MNNQIDKIINEHCGSIEKGSLKRIDSGNNSDVYAIKYKGYNAIIKLYPNDENDTRDRLGVEVDFSKMLIEEGLKNTSRVIHANKKEKYAIFHKLPGNKIKANEIRSNHWLELVEFVLEVNKIGLSVKDRCNYNASEAFFCVKEHFDSIEQRLKYILSLDKGNSKIEYDIFIQRKLLKIFNNLKEHVLQTNHLYNKLLISKTLSVSDIGFHNSLIYKNKLYFYDFEYAGWDFSGKLVTDMLINPRNLIREEVAINVITELESRLICDKWIEDLKWMIPLYSIKWCLISMRIRKGYTFEDKTQGYIWIKNANNYLNRCNLLYKAICKHLKLDFEFRDFYTI